MWADSGWEKSLVFNKICVMLYLISPAFVNKYSFNRAEAKSVVRRSDEDGSGSFDGREVVNFLSILCRGLL